MGHFGPEFARNSVDLARFYAAKSDFLTCFQWIFRSGNCLIKERKIEFEFELQCDEIRLLGNEDAAGYLEGFSRSLLQLLCQAKAAGFVCSQCGINDFQGLFSFQKQKLLEVEKHFLTNLIDLMRQNFSAVLDVYEIQKFASQHVMCALDLSSVLDLADRFGLIGDWQQLRIALLEEIKAVLSPNHFYGLYSQVIEQISQSYFSLFTTSFSQENAKNALVNLQCFTSFIEKNAQIRAKTELGRENLGFKEWIRFVHKDEVSGYIDACFNSSGVFAKVGMIQEAIKGYEYCEELWKEFQASGDGDYVENIRLVREMKQLYRKQLERGGK